MQTVDKTFWNFIKFYGEFMLKIKTLIFSIVAVMIIISQSCFGKVVNSPNMPEMRNLEGGKPGALALFRAEGVKTNCVAGTSGFCMVTMNDAHENVLAFIATNNGYDLYTIPMDKLVKDLQKINVHVKGYLLAEQLSSNSNQGDKTVSKPIVLRPSKLMFKDKDLQISGNMNEGPLTSISDEDVVLVIPLTNVDIIKKEGQFAGLALPFLATRNNY